MSNPHADARDEWAAKARDHANAGYQNHAQADAAIAQVHATAYLADAVTDVYDMLETINGQLLAASDERAEQAQALRNTIAELRGP